MPFVFVACREDQRAHARSLAAMLAERGVDACAGLEQAPAGLRESASQAAIDRCAVVAALWANGDDADPAFVDQLLYAQRSGALIAVPVNDARLPGVLGDNCTPIVWRERDPQSQTGVVALIAAELERREEEAFDDALGQAGKETKSFLRLQRRPDANALARFLRDYPGGIFETVVRDQLDGQTRPDYAPEAEGGLLNKAAQLISAGRAPMTLAGDEERAGQVWRMDNSLGSSAQAWIGSVLSQKRALFVAGLVAFVLLGSIAAAFLIASLGGPHAPTSEIAIAPQSAAAAESAPTRPPQTSVTPAGQPRQADPPAALGATSAATPPASSAPLPEAIDNPRPGTEAVSPPAPAIDNGQTERAAIESARRQDTVRGYDAYLSAYPAGGFAAEARSDRQRLLDGPPAYDLTHLEASARSAVERARASERAGRTAAARNGEPLDLPNNAIGAGAYRGSRSQGMAEGAGLVNWANGDVYSGAWSRSRPNGFGVLRLANGARYEGEFSNGAPTGRGVFWNEEGRRLMGDRLFAALVRARVQ